MIIMKGIVSDRILKKISYFDCIGGKKEEKDKPFTLLPYTSLPSRS